MNNLLVPDEEEKLFSTFVLVFGIFIHFLLLPHRKLGGFIARYLELDTQTPEVNKVNTISSNQIGQELAAPIISFVKKVATFLFNCLYFIGELLSKALYLVSGGSCLLPSVDEGEN